MYLRLACDVPTLAIGIAASSGDRFHWSGHAGFLHGRYRLIYHDCDAATRGGPALRLARVTREAAGWPIVAPSRRPT